MTYPKLQDADIKGKRVLLRAGFDVPIEDGKVVDRTRIEAMLPSMKYILDQGAALVILAHQARPKGKVVPEMSQKPVVPVLDELLELSVKFAESCTGPETKKMAEELKTGEVLLLENVRFDPREKIEKDKKDELGKELSELADVYVNDAFTNCHRDHASMTGVPKFIPSFMGLQVEQEVKGVLIIKCL